MTSMPSIKSDFLILGSGFGGSLLATILARAGRSIVMVDRSQHPRFAIGESSTPLADRSLAQLAERYNLPELRPLCRWGSWKREYPDLLCGKKRGFTYFDQTGNQELNRNEFEKQRLLVSASIDDEHSDTHWLRSDVDHHLFRLARSKGVKAFQQCQYSLSQTTSKWRLEGTAAVENEHSQSQPCTDRISLDIESPFLIDATGSPNGVLKFLNLADATSRLKTNSRSIFAHFASATTCEQLLRKSQFDVGSFPYRCDDAAVHQVLSDGWMWQLRFDDDSLSAGFMIDGRSGSHSTAHAFASPVDEWDCRIRSSPFLRRQFANAKVIRPDSGIQSTRRIQRLASRGAGTNWAAITNTVGFIDPLHSTGIAHTLFSVARLAEILLTQKDIIQREKDLANYSSLLINELLFVDELVEGCYEAIPSFRLWCLWGMLYFAAATSMEQSSDSTIGKVGFLRADDPEFRSMLREARQRLERERRATNRNRTNTVSDFETWLKSSIQPWNRVGLFNDACNNLYSSTAAPIAELHE